MALSNFSSIILTNQVSRMVRLIGFNLIFRVRYYIVEGLRYNLLTMLHDFSLVFFLNFSLLGYQTHRDRNSFKLFALSKFMATDGVQISVESIPLFKLRLEYKHVQVDNCSVRSSKFQTFDCLHNCSQIQMYTPISSSVTGQSNGSDGCISLLGYVESNVCIQLI